MQASTATPSHCFSSSVSVSTPILVYATALRFFGAAMTLVNQGTIRQVTCFTELRSQIDADAGWSPEVDALPKEDWAAVQWRVTDILRTG